MQTIRPQPRQAFRLGGRRLASSAVLCAALASRADAALPITGGVTYSLAGGGFEEPTFQIDPGTPINNAGVVVGNALLALSNGGFAGTASFRFSVDTPVVALGSLGTSASTGEIDSQVTSINRAGVSVGNAHKYTATHIDQGNRPVRWDATTITPAELNVLGTTSAGIGQGLALDINLGGTIVGYSNKYTAGALVGAPAVKWNAGTVTPIELGNLGLNSTGGSTGTANTINDNNVAVGYVEKYVNAIDQGQRAVRWNAANAVVELDGLGIASVPANTSASAIDVNNTGTAVGRVVRYTAGVAQGARAVRWAGTGSAVVELDNLGTNSSGVADAQGVDINEAGVSTGYSIKYNAAHASLGYRAVRWGATGTAAVELPVLAQTGGGLATSFAYAINDLGTIAGRVDRAPGTPDPDYAAVVWTASNAVIDLNTLTGGAESRWTLTQASSLSNTGFVTGVGFYDPDGPGGENAYKRAFTMMVPQAGTYGFGDGDLDGDIDFDDLLSLAQKYNTANPTLSLHQADFNLDGATNFNDLLALSQHYGNKFSLEGDPAFTADFAADWALAQSLVPEPGSMGLIGMLVLGSARRSRRLGRPILSSGIQRVSS